jgi:putative FmdB family regulatory protein
MPIYQYQCTDCGHALEALQKMSDPKLVDCPQCQAPALKKQVTAAAFKLKGTGWYETDFKNSGKKPAPTADSKPPSEAKSNSATSKGSE